MNDIDNVLYKLTFSKFRNSFHLKQNDFEYISLKGIDTIKSHAFDFVHKRLQGKSLFNDEKQTPTRGAPCFYCPTCNSHLLSKSNILNQFIY